MSRCPEIATFDGVYHQCRAEAGHELGHYFAPSLDSGHIVVGRSAYVEAQKAADKVARIKRLADHHRKVSPSPHMNVPLGDLEKILND